MHPSANKCSHGDCDLALRMSFDFTEPHASLRHTSCLMHAEPSNKFRRSMRNSWQRLGSIAPRGRKSVELPHRLASSHAPRATLDQLACNGAPLLHVSANFERYPCCIETLRYHDVRASSPNMSKRTTQASWWRRPLENMPGKHIGWCISIERAEKASINHGILSCYKPRL